MRPADSASKLPPELPADAQEHPPETWGLWATVGISLAIAGTWVGIQSVVGIVFAIFTFAEDPGIGVDGLAAALEVDGDYLAVATVVGALLGVPLIVLASRLRGGLPYLDYLRIQKVPLGRLLIWTVAAVLCPLAVGAGVGQFLEATKAEQFMRSIYLSTDFEPLLWVAVVLGAPAFEEALFRGFLFEGVLRSRGGPIAAVLVTSIVWTLIHIQYGAAGLILIFTGGILFGVARLATRSLTAPFVMHVAWNLAAMVHAKLVYGG